MRPNDLNDLSNMCSMYNTFRARIIQMEQQRQEMLNDVKDVETFLAKGIEQLEGLRLDLTEYFRLAEEKIDTKGSELAAKNLTVVPEYYLRHYGNTYSFCNLFRSPVGTRFAWCHRWIVTYSIRQCISDTPWQ